MKFYSLSLPELTAIFFLAFVCNLASAASFF